MVKGIVETFMDSYDLPSHEPKLKSAAE